jgi:hypothetical protein
VAPRPLLFANSDRDTIFPMDGNRRVMAKLRQVYRMYDKPDLVDEYVSKGGHEDRADLRVAAFAWMNRHLKNDASPVKYEGFKQLPGKELRAFPEDKDLPKDALNGKIDETFVKRAEVKLPEAGKFDEWKKGMIAQLKEKCFRSLPGEIPAAETVVAGKFGGKVQTEAGITVHTGQEFYNDGKAKGTGIPSPYDPRFIFIQQAEDDPEDSSWDQSARRPGLRQRLGGDDLPGHFLHVRGVEQRWTHKSPPNYVERAHALLGRTVDTGRVYDTISVARAYGARERIRLVGRGQAGIIAAYAALLEPKIKEVIIVDPPVSHRDGPIFLNVLRVLDIPEALGMLAPNVKLTLVGAKDKAFDRTAQLYKLAGAEDKFERK